MKRRKVGMAVIGTAVAVVALGACSSANPGRAAVVGDAFVPESTIAEQTRQLNELVGQPADAPNPELTRTLVSYNVGYELIGQTAATLQVTVPQSQLDLVYNQQVQQLGGEQQLQQAAAQQGVPPGNLRRDLQTQLLATAIVNKIAPGGDPQAGQEILAQAVRQVAEGIDVEVAPKYGVWDSEQLQIVPDPEPVSRPAEKPAPALPVP